VQQAEELEVPPIWCISLEKEMTGDFPEVSSFFEAFGIGSFSGSTITNKDNFESASSHVYNAEFFESILLGY